MDFPLTRVLPCLAFATWAVYIGGAIEICDSTQYMELGETGVVQCSFQEGFVGVFWYNSTEITPGSLVVSLLDSIKKGSGYESGDFDVFLNGSLKINNVSTLHDGNFTVVIIRSLESKTEQLSILVITTVKPPTRQPLIQGCASTSTTCFSIIATEVVCLVQNARPPITLEWILWTPNGGRNLSSDVTVEQNGVTSTTIITTREAFCFNTSVLSLLVCKAHSLAQMLDNDETSILIEKNDTDFSSLTPVLKFIERNSKLELLCSETHINLIVWKKLTKFHDHFEPILYAALFDETVSMTNSDSYELNPDGSLMVPHTEVKHEGVYGCAYETDVTGDRALFNVNIFVPAYPYVTGCNKYQNCTLETDAEGSITCSVTGIRPLVQLEVGTLNEHESSFITFTDREVTVNNDGDVYDIRMTLKYRVQETFQERLTLECRISGTNIEILKSTTKFDLLLSKEPAQPTKKPVLSSFLWILLILIPLSIFIIVFGRYAFRKGTGREKQNKTNYVEELHNDENMPMFLTCSNEMPFEEIQYVFIKQLRGKYEDLYNAVQPIPYIRDRLFCVDRVFVEGGLEVLVSSNKMLSDGTWEPLDSYHDIFSNSRVMSTRRILEGEPGYGKSTLTLQFSYDWCNRTSKSPLKDVQILILLRLRQLGGVTSIYRAIKQFLLPRDSQLTETDIKSIVSKSSSTVIILDGFDEYPDQDNVTTDIFNIINRQMFQDLHVVLTTRPSCLPQKYSPQTKRVRLTGFDENARTLYLKKAIVENDSVAAENIIQRLQKSSILVDLCQVTLFFVMYAHMSHESEDTLSFNSVTSLFRHMIACFHSHMFNKMGDENVEKLKLFETEHQKLDRVAWEGLIGKTQKIVWKKEKLRKGIGEDFYDQYIRTGILIEEDVLDITNVSSVNVSDLAYRKTEVRFYHKVFGEWYAAHALVDRAQKLSFWRLKTLLQNVNPFDLQYLYRFACGLNPTAAERIIKYLKKTEGGDKFAILCILEKTGDMDTTKDTITELCSEQVYIGNDDTTLLQRSTIQLLEVASRNEISISCVYLYDCNSTVYLSGGYHLQLKSNLYIPVLTTLNDLTIHEEGREITVEEFTDILQYSSKCLALKELRFWHCLLPQSVHAESVSILRSRNVKVYWGPRGIIKYCLNLLSGLWENYDLFNKRVTGVMTDNDYQIGVRKFKEKWRKE